MLCTCLLHCKNHNYIYNSFLDSSNALTNINFAQDSPELIFQLKIYWVSSHYDTLIIREKESLNTYHAVRYDISTSMVTENKAEIVYHVSHDKIYS